MNSSLQAIELEPGTSLTKEEYNEVFGNGPIYLSPEEEELAELEEQLKKTKKDIQDNHRLMAEMEALQEVSIESSDTYLSNYVRQKLLALSTRYPMLNNDKIEGVVHTVTDHTISLIETLLAFLEKYIKVRMENLVELKEKRERLNKLFNSVRNLEPGLTSFRDEIRLSPEEYVLLQCDDSPLDLDNSVHSLVSLVERQHNCLTQDRLLSFLGMCLADKQRLLDTSLLDTLDPEDVPFIGRNFITPFIVENQSKATARTINQFGPLLSGTKRLSRRIPNKEVIKRGSADERIRAFEKAKTGTINVTPNYPEEKTVFTLSLSEIDNLYGQTEILFDLQVRNLTAFDNLSDTLKMFEQTIKYLKKRNGKVNDALVRANIRQNMAFMSFLIKNLEEPTLSIDRHLLAVNDLLTTKLTIAYSSIIQGAPK